LGIPIHRRKRRIHQIRMKDNHQLLIMELRPPDLELLQAERRLSAVKISLNITAATISK